MSVQAEYAAVCSLIRTLRGIARRQKLGAQTASLAGHREEYAAERTLTLQRAVAWRQYARCIHPDAYGLDEREAA